MFAPTIVILGFSGGPMPASLVMFLYAILPERSDYDDYAICFHIATVAFFVTWAIMFLFAFGRLALRLDRARNEQSASS